MISPGSKFGDYKVVRRLGKGGMGEVWLLRSPEGGDVATKILDPSAGHDHESRRRFVHEAELAMGVKNPNLVEVFDVGEDPETGLCYILMEYVAGGTLQDRIRQSGALEVGEAVAIVKAIAGVLDEAAARRIVHRDIKPANIMFDASGTPKLADLGIARGGLNGSSEMTTVTQTGVMMGTPAYMSPEQMLDSHHVDTRADIYSLGVVFYEMLTGERPNKDDTVVQLMAKAIAGEAIPDVRTRRSEISAAIANVVSRMTRPNVEDRVSSPRELLGLLTRIEQDRFVHADSPRQRNLRKRKNRRILLLSALLAALGASGLGFGALLYWRAQSAEKPSPTTTLSTGEPIRNVPEVKTSQVAVPTTVPPADSQGEKPSTPRHLEDGTHIIRHDGADWTVVVENGRGRIGDGKHVAVSPEPQGHLVVPDKIDGVLIDAVAAGAFQNCSKVTEVVFSKGIRSIGSSSLFSVPAKSVDFGCITDFKSGSLGYLVGLERVTISPDNPTYCLRDGSIYSKDGKELIFCNRKATGVVRIPRGVELIGSAAFERTPVESVIIPSTVKKIGMAAFGNCHSLTNITFEGEGLCHLEAYALSNCMVERLVFPDSLERVDRKAFRLCTRLKSVVFGRKLRRIENCTFEICKSLEGIEFRGPPPEVEENMDDVFGGASKDAKIVFSGKIRPKGDLWPEGSKTARPIVRSGDVIQKTTFADRTWKYREVKGGISLQTTIKKSAGMPEGAIDPMPSGQFVLPARLNGMPVVRVGESAFSYAKGLRYVIIAEGVRELNGWGIFWGCSELERVVIPKSMNRIDGWAVFFDNPSLKELDIRLCSYFDPNAICKCPNFQRFRCDPENRVYTADKDGVLYTKGSNGKQFILARAPLAAKEVAIPESVGEIGPLAFKDCIALKRLLIPAGVKKISHLAFQNCTNLTEVVVPASLTDIAKDAFEGCRNPEKILVCTKAENPGVFVFEGFTVVFPKDHQKEGTIFCEQLEACEAFVSRVVDLPKAAIRAKAVRRIELFAENVASRTFDRESGLLRVGVKASSDPQALAQLAAELLTDYSIDHPEAEIAEELRQYVRCKFEASRPECAFGKETTLDCLVRAGRRYAAQYGASDFSGKVWKYGTCKTVVPSGKLANYRSSRVAQFLEQVAGSRDGSGTRQLLIEGYYKAKHHYRKKFTRATVPINDFVALLSIAANRNLFPVAREFGLKVDPHATSIPHP